jgi:hypothetical protein
MRTIARMSRRWQIVTVLAAQLSLAAGIIHFIVMPEHFAEWWGYGAFFLVLAAAQIVYAELLLYCPRPSLFLAGILGNLCVIALWAWARAVAVPLFGPGVGEREAVGTIDLVSKGVELALMAVLTALLWSYESVAPAPRTDDSSPANTAGNMRLTPGREP